MKLSEINDNEMVDDEYLVKQIITRIDKECKQIINEMGGWSTWLTENIRVKDQYNLIRGMRPTSLYGIRSARSQRTPKDTWPEIHQIIDDWFFQKFGYRYRSNAIFAVSNVHTAESYGHPCLIFPRGHFRFCYSPDVEDLWDGVKMTLHKNFKSTVQKLATIESDEHFEQAVNQIISKLEGAGYTETNLREAIGYVYGSSEIMIGCKDYYYVKAKWFNKHYVPVVEHMLESGEIK
jgi:hypothetical protein